MPVNNYLESGNPEHNLKVLSSIKMAEASTYCTTKEAHKLTPWAHYSEKELREWSITGAAILALNSMTLYPLGGIATCVIGGGASSGSLLTTAEHCVHKTVARCSDGSVLLIGMMTASLAGLASIAWYAMQSYYYRDRKLHKRFCLLKKEYAAVAQHLIEQFNQAKAAGDTKKLEGLRATAKLLKANKQLNSAALQEVVYLTETQANLLTSQIQAVAKGILIG